MDIFMTMFKPRPSQSPVITSAAKRPNDSPARQAKVFKTDNHHKQEAKPKFTFDQVKCMLENMLKENDKNKKMLVSQGLKNFDFSNIAVSGHSADQCRELIDRLVKNTRRVRTLNEVLNEIKDNLERKSYTEIIQRASLDNNSLPKRPPSAYLLYHQDRFQDLKNENPLAAEISKIVSEEWKNLSDRKRREYQKKHNDLMRFYENEMKRLGLVNDAEPKRPGNARVLYIQDRIDSTDIDDYSKEDMTNLQRQFGEEFDALDKESKKYWKDLAKEKLEQYKEERVQFTASHPHLKPKLVQYQRSVNNAASGRSRKPDMPQPPRTALKLYIDKKMPEGIEGEEAEDVKRKLKEKFSQLSPKKQLKFIKKAIKDKARYDQEVEEFIAAHPEYTEQLRNKEVKAHLTKEQWKIYYTMVENRPSLPAPTTYLYYCGKLLSDDTYSSGIEPTQRMQFASQSWRNLSDNQRAKIEKEHAESIEKYINDMNAWLEEAGPERRKQIFLEEPRANPEYWRKRVNRSKKAAAKKLAD